MQGSRELDGIRRQIEDIVDRGLDGDIYETGIWRGGTAIFMVSVLTAYEKLRGKEPSNRHFYFFDSFEGFSAQGEDADLDEYLSSSFFEAPLELVRRSFQSFGVLSDRIHFVKGFFEETVPNFKVHRPLALLRMDGDLYSSTKVVLERFYPEVQPGGWIVADDYDWMPSFSGYRFVEIPLCRQAVDEYRAAHDIRAPLTKDFARPSWKKPDGESESNQADNDWDFWKLFR